METHICFLYLIIKAVHGDSCQQALAPPSPVLHKYAESGQKVDKLAFSSCYVPEDVPSNSSFWTQVRGVGTDVWLWLGDNMYSDGNDMNTKRLKYNLAREERSYMTEGPVKTGSEIPVMATWDDHDCCSNNEGNTFPCLGPSQQEFAIHFNLPKDHPINMGQEGVYNSQMFVKPGTSEPGIHVIMLDARTGRDPTIYSKFGECKGSETKVLSEVQWEWLEDQLNIESEVTVIGSGVQVLPPTSKDREHTEYCADDSHSGGGTTFADGQEVVGEGLNWVGTKYEAWAEVPLERARLLGLAQRAVNIGKTKVVVFVSGDQHWAELQAKRMPQSSTFGEEQVLYEVTASGVYQKYNHDIENSNRLRERSCDRIGEGAPYNQACVFPFRYDADGETYESCAPLADWPWGWCSTKTDSTHGHITDNWGNCSPPESEMAQETYSGSSKTCSSSNFHICYAQSNYGFIHVNFEYRTLKMGINTPEEREEMYHLIKY